MRQLEGVMFSHHVGSAKIQARVERSTRTQVDNRFFIIWQAMANVILLAQSEAGNR